MRDVKLVVRSLNPVDAELSFGIASNEQRFPNVVNPECSSRGSSQSFAWIPAKSMRE
jgi:hypothetical protein